jgi:hypothetical protein
LYKESQHYTIIKTVTLKVSFDKRWGEINENEITAANETLWGKLTLKQMIMISNLNRFK